MLETIICGVVGGILAAALFLAGYLLGRYGEFPRTGALKIGGQPLLSRRDLREWNRFLNYDGTTAEEGRR